LALGPLGRKLRAAYLIELAIELDDLPPEQRADDLQGLFESSDAPLVAIAEL